MRIIPLYPPRAYIPNKEVPKHPPITYPTIPPPLTTDPESPNVNLIKMLNIGEPILEIIIIVSMMWITMLEITWYLITIYAILLIWVLIGSPYIHYYILHEGPIYLPPEHQTFKYWMFQARGLGSPFTFYTREKDGGLYFMKYGFQMKWFTILIGFLLFGGGIHYEDRFANIMYDIFGYTSYSAELWVTFVIISVGGLLIVFIGCPLYMRLDNFLLCFNNYFLQLSGIALTLIIIFGLNFQILWDWWVSVLGTGHRWSLKEPTPLVRIQHETFVSYFSVWVGYILWGWLQQLLFLGCFATQLSRGFDVRNSKYGKVYCCLLSALMFASMHAPSYWLSLATGIFGFLWAWRFVEVPNLAVFGINHGMLATLCDHLLPISFSVGPSHLI